MERTWMDKRSGKQWELDAIPTMQRMRPGDSVPMMNEVPWHIWFRATDESHETRVEADFVMRLATATDQELQMLLDEAKRR